MTDIESIEETIPLLDYATAKLTLKGFKLFALVEGGYCKDLEAALGLLDYLELVERDYRH